MEQKDKINEDYQFPAGIGSVYFIGIGGIGMSALAKFFHEKGVAVSGYDKTPGAVTAALQKSGIPVHFEEDVAQLPENPDYVVYTPAVPAAHAELVQAREKGMNVVKRSDILQVLTGSSFNVCIAGTHGKTTISSMTAHLLRASGFGCNAFLGGISVNYDTNNWSDKRNVCVVEADEYDRSFLKLNPGIAVITAMDPDHLDIYGTAAAMEEAFIAFSKNVEPGGLLIRQFGLKRGKELKADRVLTYSLQNESADVYAKNIMITEGAYRFDVMIKDVILENAELHMGGMHNVENAVAAIAVAVSLNIDHDKIRQAIAGFRGVKRRFEYIIRNNRLVFIDDYAHHPEELRALIQGAKSLYRQRKCTVIFQPHLFTRTRDFAGGFAEVLDAADEVILLPIYPAREEPIAGVSSEMILSKMNQATGKVMQKDELIKWASDYAANVNHEFGNMLITAGAGDIDALVEPLKNILNKV